ncbi:hypothetical protein BCR44DRAFT_1530212, partial [Catenaria anguillulae PL171]
ILTTFNEQNVHDGFQARRFLASRQVAKDPASLPSWHPDPRWRLPVYLCHARSTLRLARCSPDCRTKQLRFPVRPAFRWRCLSRLLGSRLGRVDAQRQDVSDLTLDGHFDVHCRGGRVDQSEHEIVAGIVAAQQQGRGSRSCVCVVDCRQFAHPVYVQQVFGGFEPRGQGQGGFGRGQGV